MCGQWTCETNNISLVSSASKFARHLHTSLTKARLSHKAKPLLGAYNGKPRTDSRGFTVLASFSAVLLHAASACVDLVVRQTSGRHSSSLMLIDAQSLGASITTYSLVLCPN